jgi:hypothetical protein
MWFGGGRARAGEQRKTSSRGSRAAARDGLSNPRRTKSLPTRGRGFIPATAPSARSRVAATAPSCQTGPSFAPSPPNRVRLRPSPPCASPPQPARRLRARFPRLGTLARFRAAYGRKRRATPSLRAQAR